MKYDELKLDGETNNAIMIFKIDGKYIIQYTSYEYGAGGRSRKNAIMLAESYLVRG